MEERAIRQIQEFMREMIPFNRYLGMELVALEQGLARMELPYRPEFIGDPFRPALHGGVVSALLDTCGGAAAFSVVGLGDRVSTVDLRVDYLRPGREERLVAEGRVVRAGNRVCVVNLLAFHPGGEAEPIAQASAVYNVRRATPGEGSPLDGVRRKPG
jgi:uncharacterized protein (TIGR00369 family)